MHHKRRSRRDHSPHYGAWDRMVIERKAPATSEVCNGKAHSKRVRPKKEKCPVNGTHEWYKETVIRKDKRLRPLPGWWGCQACRKASSRFSWSIYYRAYCSEHIQYEPFVETADIKTCIHCWVEKKISVVQDPPRWGRYERTRPLVLKKRPIRF